MSDSCGRTKIIPCSICGSNVEVSVHTHRVYCNACREKVYANNNSLAASHRYRHSEKGLEAKRRDESSVTGKARGRRYWTSEKGWEGYRGRAEKYYVAHKTEECQNRYNHQHDCLLEAEKYFGEPVNREAQFYDLKDNVSRNHLKVDGWFKSSEVLLEVHGAQHYLPVRFGSITEFEAVNNLLTYQRRERIKQQYCLDRHYRYVVIPFCILPEMVSDCIETQLNIGPMVVSRRFDISYAHKLSSVLLSDEDNEFLFGKCSLPNFHGHNMQVRVSVKGFVDPLTHMVINFADLKGVAEAVLSAFDHKNLNLDFKEFRDGVATAESLACYLWEDFSIELPNLFELELWETEDCKVLLRRGPKGSSDTSVIYTEEVK